MTEGRKFIKGFCDYGDYLFRDVQDGIRKIRREIWNKRIKLWWHKLFIRKDEFHQSLNIDVEAMLAMNRNEQETYLYNLTKRRAIAHERDLA